MVFSLKIYHLFFDLIRNYSRSCDHLPHLRFAGTNEAFVRTLKYKKLNRVTRFGDGKRHFLSTTF